jgi:hemoglobin/transferrin/lactoferrin receptor protein
MKKIGTIVFVLFAYVLQAQTDTNYNLDEVVISGSRFPDKRKEVAQKIDVIKLEAIAFSNSNTTADLLQQSGKVLVQKSQQGGGSPIIRGFEASRILLVVDGVRLNNAIYRAGHLQNIITMDPSILAKAEIAYGPSSVVYGSDALGGVIHFHTRNPDLLSEDENPFSGGAMLRYASAANSMAGNLHFNVASKKVASFTSVSYSDFGDLKVGSVENGEYGNFNFRPYYVVTNNGVDELVKNDDKTIQVQSGYTQYDVLEKLLYQQNNKISHLLNFQYSTSTDIPRYDRLTDPLNDDSLRSAQWYYGPQERLMAAYEFKYQSVNKLFDMAHLTASYQAIEESRHDRRYGRTTLNHRTENVGVIGFNFDFSKTVKKSNIRYGLESYLNDVSSIAEAENIEDGTFEPLDTRYPDGGSNMNNFAGYISHNLKFGAGKWILNDGIRYNYNVLTAKFTDKSFFPFPYDEINQSNGALTGSLGLIYSPDNATRVALNGSTGFRTPNIDDLTKVFESEPGTIVVPNPDIKPEYTYNIDLNMVKVFADRVELELTGFYTIATNYFSTQPSTFEGEDSIMYDGELSQVLTTGNSASAYLYGFNAGIDIKISDMFSFASYITYTYGRIKTDSTPYPLDHIPPMYGRTSFNFKTDKIHAELFALYNGWKRIEDYNIVGGEDNEQYATVDGMPAWYTLNLKASYTIKDWLEVQAGCENILDLNYRVFASGIGAPGRNLFLALRTKF